MTQPIKIHPVDADDAAVRQRHADIEKRLEELGPDRVRMSMFHGGLPTEWHQIIQAWLSGDKLEPESVKSADESVKSSPDR